MKKILILILICVAQNLFSQTKNYKTTIPNDENKVYKIPAVEDKPDFPRGMNEFYKFVGKNYNVPKKMPASVVGKIHATFIVEKDGSLSDIKILRDIGYGTGAEAIRVLKLSPKWIPGKLKGNAVRVLYGFPITIEAN